MMGNNKGHYALLVVAIIPSLFLLLTNFNRYDSMMNRVSMLIYENSLLKGKIDELESQLMELKDLYSYRYKAEVEEGAMREKVREDNTSTLGQDSISVDVRDNANISYGSASNANRFILNTYDEVSSIIMDDVSMLNDIFTLPYDVKIGIDDSSSCIVAAYYSSKEKSITICYSTLKYLDDYAKKVSGDDAERLEIVDANIKFILYHEVAHALIDAYNIPIIGREESAADTFAILTMLNNNDKGIQHVIRFYDTVREDKPVSSNIAYWDEHMLFAQTYYDMLCLAYGKDSNTYSMYKDLLNDRVERCKYEYDKQVNAFNTLFVR